MEQYQSNGAFSNCPLFVLSCLATCRGLLIECSQFDANSITTPSPQTILPFHVKSLTCTWSGIEEGPALDIGARGAEGWTPLPSLPGWRP